LPIGIVRVSRTGGLWKAERRCGARGVVSEGELRVEDVDDIVGDAGADV